MWPLYVSTKTFICCDLTTSLYNVWLPWVVAGSLALVLCVLASIRVIQATMMPVGLADFPQARAVWVPKGYGAGGPW